MKTPLLGVGYQVGRWYSPRYTQIGGGGRGGGAENEEGNAAATEDEMEAEESLSRLLEALQMSR
jgi:hypothetical protein